jgi:hypothetical protein
MTALVVLGLVYAALAAFWIALFYVWPYHSWRWRKPQMQIELKLAVPKTSIRISDTYADGVRISADAKDAAQIPALLRMLADAAEAELRVTTLSPQPVTQPPA